MYFQALSLSFLIHGLVLAGLWVLESTPPEAHEPPRVVQIEFLDGTQKQIVADAVAPNLDLFSQSATRLESARDQRVLEQQQASRSGATENRSRLKQIPEELIPAMGSQQDGSASLKDLAQSGSGADTKQQQVVDQVKREEVYERLFDKEGISSIQDRLFEDVKFGNFTALNTNRNQFYSFYQRINEQVRIRWVENIQFHIDQLRLQAPGSRFKSGEWISRLEIILNDKGEIVHSYVAKSSGQSRWDEAALSAFHSAAPFVNPPRGMKQSDGTIRLSYLFSLQL